MFWIYLALLAYIINAIVFVIDKYLLAGPIPRPYAYTFGVSVLSLVALFLIPFGVSWQGFNYLIVSLLSGTALFLGLIFLYKTVKESDVSVAATQVGAIGAISTYILSILILGDVLSLSHSLAFIFLVLGIFLLGKIEKHIFYSAILAGVLMSVYFVLLKLAFNNADFINGLFWTRAGFVGSAFMALMFSNVREDIKFSYGNSSKKSKSLFVFNKFIAGIGFIILYFAIQLGNVSIVNALLGFQFLVIFMVALAFRNKLPAVKENIAHRVLAYKIIGIVSVGIGLALLFI